VPLLRIVPAEIPGKLRIIGELDISNVEEVQARLEQELLDSRQLTLDASELSFMDSQGLRMLIALGQQVAAQGRVIFLLNCPAEVIRILEIAVPQGIPGVEVRTEDT
jgi:anti-anti-sigma factor